MWKTAYVASSPGKKKVKICEDGILYVAGIVLFVVFCKDLEYGEKVIEMKNEHLEIRMLSGKISGIGLQI